MAKAAFSILSVFMAVPLSVTAVGSMLDVAVRGQSAEYVIVTSASASESQRYAAEELRDFMQKTTGVCLPIADDNSPLPAKAILLGETKYTENLLPNAANTVAGLGEDGFRLVARPPHLLVIASPVRGTLYGVYEILERFAGCRWYASWHSVIPKIDKLSIPADLDDTQVPAFIMRDPGWYDLRENPAFAARLRVNQFKPELATMVSRYGGVAQSWGMLNPCHTLSVLLPPKKYFAEHPEYYALVNGKRGPGAMSGAEAKQPCLTNPDVLRIVTSNVLEWIRREPQYPIYGVSQTDGWYNYCSCPDCAAVDEEEGSHSGTVVRFVNAVAEAVEREFPGKMVETLAYNWSRKPPAKTKLRDNVAVYLCTMGADHARSFPESPHPKTIAFREDLKGWQSICRNVMIWDYVTNFGHYLSPHPSAYGIFRNIPFYRDCGVTHLFTQADSRGAHASFSALMAWVESKLMWNPDVPLDALLDEFFAGYYGDAAPFVREYFEDLHRFEYDYTADPNHALGMTTPPTNPAIPDSFLDEATELWAKAAEAVKGKRPYEYNVRMGSICVDYMRLERLRSDINKSICLVPKSLIPGKLVEAKRLAGKVLETLATEKNIQLSEGGHARRVKGLVELLAKESPEIPAGNGSAVIEEKDIPYAKNLAGRDWGRYVDDLKADDGRALKLITLCSNQGVRFQLGKVEFEEGAKYRIRARVRVDKAGEGNAFEVGLLDNTAGPNGTPFARVAKRTDEVSGEYEWYDVADYNPAKHPFAAFYIMSGVFPNGGRSAVKGVYLDKIEISKVQ